MKFKEKFALFTYVTIIIAAISFVIQDVHKKQESKTGVVAGSAWVLNENGYIVTAYHVVNGRTSFAISKRGEYLKATLIAGDPKNDIAILKIEVSQSDYLPLELKFNDNEPVSIYGYPLPDELGTNLKVSEGSLKHQVFSDYIRSYNGKVCPGNSGGPMIGNRGVVGVLTESVWPDGKGCSTTSQGPSSDKVAELAKQNGVLYHVNGGTTHINTITNDEVMLIFAW